VSQKSVVLYSLLLAFCLQLNSNSVQAQTGFSYAGITQTFRPAPVPNQVNNPSPISINAKGQVAYQGDNNVFLGSATNPSATVVVAKAGDTAPGGGKIISATRPSINGKGQVAFSVYALAPSATGIYLYAAGKLQLLVASGTVTSAGVISNLSNPSLNDSGDCAFTTNLGIFLVSHGVVTKIAKRGDVAPSGDRFSSLSSPSINANGKVVFLATLSSGNSGIYLAANGNISKIVYSGDPAPNGGQWVGFINAPALNDTGQVAFAGLVNGGSTNGNGIYVYQNGSMQIKLPIPFTASNGVTVGGANNPSLNNAGDISVVGFYSAGAGIFVTSNGSVVEAMTPTQTTPDGLTYANAGSQKLNDAGQVAFSAWLVQQVKGLYVYSPNTTVRIGGKNSLLNRTMTPVFVFPGPTSITQDGRALIFDGTSPGGQGLFLGSPSPSLNQVSAAAYVGEPLPGGGVISSIVFAWNMNDVGAVVFNASGSLGQDSIVRSSGGTLTNVVGSGETSPDGGTFGGFASPAINHVGHIVFPGWLTNGGAGLYLWKNGVLSSLGSGDLVAATDDPSINDADDVAFFSQPYPAPYGIYLYTNGNMIPIALDGDPAPGGDYYSLPYADTTFGPILNNQGDVVFSAFLAGGGEATYLYSQGVVTRIAGPGDPTPDGDTFADTYLAWINDAGSIVFSAGTYSGDYGVYEYAGGNLITVAHAGTVIPGFGPLLDASSSPSINAAGQIAFNGDLLDGTVAAFIATPQANSFIAHTPAKVTSKPQAANRQAPPYLRVGRPSRKGHNTQLGPVE